LLKALLEFGEFPSSAGRRNVATQQNCGGGGMVYAPTRTRAVTEGTQTAVSTVKKSIVVGLKSEKGNEVEHILLEDLLAAI
jgi:hypothetical protein